MVGLCRHGGMGFGLLQQMQGSTQDFAGSLVSPRRDAGGDELFQFGGQTNVQAGALNGHYVV